MKKILCYGDSNTFGFNPVDGTRYDNTLRWTGILQKNLTNEYEILEEGACDRTGFVNNPKGFLYSAQRNFPKLISKLPETDIIILAIGTNDLQFQYDISFQTIENGLESLILSAKNKTDNIILVPSIILNEDILNGFFKIQFDEKSITKSRKVGRLYKKAANIFHCHFFDFNKFVSPSKADGLHYNKEGHKIIANELANYIRKEF